MLGDDSDFDVCIAQAAGRAANRAQGRSVPRARTPEPAEIGAESGSCARDRAALRALGCGLVRGRSPSGRFGWSGVFTTPSVAESQGTGCSSAGQQCGDSATSLAVRSSVATT